MVYGDGTQGATTMIWFEIIFETDEGDVVPVLIQGDDMSEALNFFMASYIEVPRETILSVTRTEYCVCMPSDDSSLPF